MLLNVTLSIYDVSHVQNYSFVFISHSAIKKILQYLYSVSVFLLNLFHLGLDYYAK